MVLRNRLAGNTNSYHSYPLEAALEGIAAAGYRFVELSAVRGWTEHVPLDVDARALGRIQRMLNRLGLIAVSLSGHSDLTTPDGLELGMVALDLCERLGIDIMNTAIGGHASQQEDEAAFLANISRLADRAAEQDILIGIEIHGEITNSARNAIPVIEQINRPNVRLNYDTANVEFYAGISAVDDLALGIPYMVHGHLKDHIGGLRDWNFPAIGEGQIDFARLLGLLEQGGYTGPLSVEIEFSGEPWPSLAEINRSMKSSYQHLASLGLS
ncbi:MAG: sugar phosphate isomerase/epimerase [Anaerolineae bacterium]|nr:sugar phosphate isomerase/epimerase [Anaerolineae bacterium]